jgi:hypothetical protein
VCGEKILLAPDNGLEILGTASQNTLSVTSTLRNGNRSVVNLDEPAALAINVETIGCDDFFQRRIESAVQNIVDDVAYVLGHPFTPIIQNSRNKSAVRNQTLDVTTAENGKREVAQIGREHLVLEKS